MSTPANFNGARPVIDVNDAVMLLIDHQSGLFQTVGICQCGTALPCGCTGKNRYPGEDPGDHHRVRPTGTERTAYPGDPRQRAACAVCCP